RRGLTVVAADRDPSAPGFRYADRRAIVSIEDERAIERLARAEQADGLVAPGSDHAVALAARLRQRERLQEAGVPQPRSVVARTLAEVTRAADELGYPIVLEAPDRTGERGVGLARNRAEVAAAAADALAESHGEYCL